MLLRNTIFSLAHKWHVLLVVLTVNGSMQGMQVGFCAGVDSNGHSIIMSPENYKFLFTECETALNAQPSDHMRLIDLTGLKEGANSDIATAQTIKESINLLRHPAQIQKADEQKAIKLKKFIEYFAVSRDVTRSWAVQANKALAGDPKNSVHRIIEHFLPSLAHKLVLMRSNVDEYDLFLPPSTKEVPQNDKIQKISDKDLHQEVERLVKRDYIERYQIKKLNLNDQSISHFSLKDILTILPGLKQLVLGNNRIEVLSLPMVEGMPDNFELYINKNPIKHIDKAVLKTLAQWESAQRAVHIWCLDNAISNKQKVRSRLAHSIYFQKMPNVAEESMKWGMRGGLVSASVPFALACLFWFTDLFDTKIFFSIMHGVEPNNEVIKQATLIAKTQLEKFIERQSPLVGRIIDECIEWDKMSRVIAKSSWNPLSAMCKFYFVGTLIGHWFLAAVIYQNKDIHMNQAEDILHLGGQH